MSDENIWRLINDLTMSVHKHDETHNPIDYAEIANRKAALTKYIAALEAEVEELQARVDGYHPINRFPSLGDWVLVRFVPGFIQPYKVVQYLEDKFGNRRFGPHMDRQIDRWWPLPEVHNE